MPIVEPQAAPLFPAHPPTTMLPIFAWAAYTNPTQRITSSLATPQPLSAIPASVVCMMYYHSPHPDAPNANTYKTFDYGDSRPYTFRLPDGTTRVNTSPMSAQAYSNLVANIWSSDTYPP